jgi:hypothetical protein
MQSARELVLSRFPCDGFEGVLDGVLSRRQRAACTAPGYKSASGVIQSCSGHYAGSGTGIENIDELMNAIPSCLWS